MHPNQRPTTPQQQRVRYYAGNTDSHAMFNLLTGPQLFDHIEGLLPKHRERLFPPTETLSMFLACRWRSKPAHNWRTIAIWQGIR